MNFLIVAATKFEIDLIIDDLKIIKNINDNEINCCFKENNVNVLITGVGIYNTVYHLSKHLQKNSYDLIINVGIAGSFTKNIRIGNCVEVKEEMFSDILISDINIQSLFEYGLMKDDNIFENGILKNRTEFNTELTKVKGFTTNSLNYNLNFNSQISNKFNVDIETMEGAAFFFVCLNEKAKFIEIRAVSNYIGESDKSKWNIDSARKSLHLNILKLIEK